MARRIAVVVVVVTAAVDCGAAGALAPIWLVAGQDLEPPGKACWIEQDPGSGASAVGVERSHGGLVPYTECVPVAEPAIPPGDAFDEAARHALAGEEMPVSSATRDAANDAEALPRYQVIWPVFAAVASICFALAFGLTASAVSKKRRTVRPAVKTGSATP